jgi:hypothetical protein
VALATVDQNIDTAKRPIISIPPRRNMLAPISILTVETLARTFQLNVSSVRPYSPTLRLNLWMTLSITILSQRTHVSRRSHTYRRTVSVPLTHLERLVAKKYPDPVNYSSISADC